MNYIESKTNNHNLYNIKLNSTLVDTFAKVQYYLAQPAVAKALLASTSYVFERQSNYFQTNVFAEQVKDVSQNITYFMRDYLSTKFLFVGGQHDYITYYKAARAWL